MEYITSNRSATKHQYKGNGYVGIKNEVCPVNASHQSSDQIHAAYNGARSLQDPSFHYHTMHITSQYRQYIVHIIIINKYILPFTSPKQDVNVLFTISKIYIFSMYRLHIEMC